VELYYTYSPPVADLIARHDKMRFVVRWTLLPLVGVSWMALHSGPWVTLALLVLLICLMGGSAVATLRRRRSKHQA